jgi:hypothetical protein
MSARQMTMLISVGRTKGKSCRVGSDPVCDILTALTVYMTFFLVCDAVCTGRKLATFRESVLLLSSV